MPAGAMLSLRPAFGVPSAWSANRKFAEGAPELTCPQGEQPPKYRDDDDSAENTRMGPLSALRCVLFASRGSNKRML